LNRLIFPLSEHAMPDWIRRTALGDILQQNFSALEDETLYRNLDRLHPNREAIERELAEREKTLFNLEDSVFLYDLTSTYFEGQAEANPQAKRGYSRDKRPDCKQVVVGLVLDRDGFPKAHEVFDGNLQDRRSLKTMLEALEKRMGKKPGATVIVDRGLAYDEDLEEIRNHGLHYLVAARQTERSQWLDQLEEDTGWEEVVRAPSPRNPAQKKTRVEIKRQQKGDGLYILCRSEGREEKDRAIRETQEAKLLADLNKLRKRVEQGHLKQEAKIQQAIGRLRERYPRVARYYQIVYDAVSAQLSWKELVEKKAIARKVDGTYILKTDRQDLTAEEIWRTYILAHARGGCLPRHEDSAAGAAHFSSSATSSADPHLPLCAGLSPASRDRASVFAGRDSHLVVECSPTAQYSSCDDHCFAHEHWPDTENSQSDRSRGRTPRDLRDTSHNSRGHEAYQELARRLIRRSTLVTKKNLSYRKHGIRPKIMWKLG
jgi:hypothetical protein